MKHRARRDPRHCYRRWDMPGYQIEIEVARATPGDPLKIRLVLSTLIVNRKKGLLLEHLNSGQRFSLIPAESTNQLLTFTAEGLAASPGDAFRLAGPLKENSTRRGRPLTDEQFTVDGIPEPDNG